MAMGNHGYHFMVGVFLKGAFCLQWILPIRTPGRRRIAKQCTHFLFRAELRGSGAQSLTKWPDIWFAAKAAVIKHLRWTPLHRKFSTRRTRVLIIRTYLGVRWWGLWSLFWTGSLIPPYPHPRHPPQNQNTVDWSPTSIRLKLLASAAASAGVVFLWVLRWKRCNILSALSLLCFSFYKAVEAAHNKSLQPFF